MKEFIRRCVVYVLTLESRVVIKKYKPRIVVVTGSVGKTSSKDAAFTALSAQYFVRRSEKSFNSDIGAPLTVLGIPNGWSNPVRWFRNIIDGIFLIIMRAPYPAWLIVEVGADRPGDISKSLSWLRPEVVVATRFPATPVHVEFYDSPEDVQREELAPLSWLRPGGIAVINVDDDVLQNATVPDGVEIVTFGIHENADVRALRIKITATKGFATGISFDVSYRGEKVHIALRSVVGLQHVYAALAGIAAAVAVGVPLEKMKDAFENHSSAKSRMRLIDGVRGSLIVDDTYNSSPVAAEQALFTLSEMPTPTLSTGQPARKIAVMGDMLELGSYSVTEHERVGRIARDVVDILVTVGVRSRGIAEAARKAGLPESQILMFDRGLDAEEHLATIIERGDTVLVKGSQGVRLEKVVKKLMAHPEDAPKLLCRQDTEWLMR